MAAPIAASGANFDPGRPVALFRRPMFGGGMEASTGSQYDVARDGRILINLTLDKAQPPITLLQNWHPTLQK